MPSSSPPQDNLDIAPCTFDRNSVRVAAVAHSGMILQDNHRPGLSVEELIRSINIPGDNNEEEWLQHYQQLEQQQWQPRPAPDEAAGGMQPIPTSGTSRTQSGGSSHRGQSYHHHRPDMILNTVQHHPSSVSARGAASAFAQQQCQQYATEIQHPSSFAPPYPSLRRPSSTSENIPRDSQQRQQAEAFYPQDTTGVGRSRTGQGLALNSRMHHHDTNLAPRHHSSPQVNTSTLAGMGPSSSLQAQGHNGERLSRLSLSPRPASRGYANGRLDQKPHSSRHIDNLDICGAPTGPSFSQHRQPSQIRTSDELLESMLQRLSADEKEQLLCQLLLSRNGVPQQHHPLQPRHLDLEIRSSQGNYKKRKAQLNGLSDSEKDMLNVQLGLLLSFKKVEEEEGAQRRKPRSPINSVDERALEFGLMSSKLEWHEWCLQKEKQARVEQAILENAMMASLMDPPAPSAKAVSKEECIIEQVKKESLFSPIKSILSSEEENCLMEEAKRASLAPDEIRRRSTSSASLHFMIEKAKRESLTDNFHLSMEERLIEDVKQDSMAVGVPSFVECRRDVLCGTSSLRNSFRLDDLDRARNELFGLQVEESALAPESLKAQRKSSRSSTTFPLTEDDASFEVKQNPDCMTMMKKLSFDDDLSFTEDRKPPARQDPRDFPAMPRTFFDEEDANDLTFLNSHRNGGSFDETSHPAPSSGRKSWRSFWFNSRDDRLSKSEH